MDHLQQKQDWHSSSNLVVVILEVSPKTSRLSQYLTIFPEACPLTICFQPTLNKSKSNRLHI